MCMGKVELGLRNEHVWLCKSTWQAEVGSIIRPLGLLLVRQSHVLHAPVPFDETKPCIACSCSFQHMHILNQSGLIDPSLSSGLQYACSAGLCSTSWLLLFHTKWERQEWKGLCNTLAPDCVCFFSFREAAMSARVQKPTEHVTHQNAAPLESAFQFVQALWESSGAASVHTAHPINS